MAPSDHSLRRRRKSSTTTTRAAAAARRKSSGTTTRAAAAKAKATRPRRAQYKKHKLHVQQVKQPKNVKKETIMEDLLPSNSSTTTLVDDNHGIDQDTSSNSCSECSTPKAQRFRISEIVTCPPAPKKQRVVSNCSSLQRNPARPIAFFAPPDLELFFFFALRDISV